MKERRITSDSTKSFTPQCKIVLHRWNEDVDQNTFSSVNDLAKSTKLDISSALVDCTFDKNIGGPSGSFSFTLANSVDSDSVALNDWKEIIRPGMWVVIYMAQDGNLQIRENIGQPIKDSLRNERKYIRCIGYVDRVAVTNRLLESGAPEYTFQISGRDYGLIYEESVIWQNIFESERTLLENIGLSKLNVLGNTKINEIIDIVHDLMYYPYNISQIRNSINKNDSILKTSLQWIFPRTLIEDINGSIIPRIFSPYIGNVIRKNLQNTIAGISISSPIDYIYGNPWTNLQRLSIPQFHELYTELSDDGYPTIHFRPIPFAIDKSGYPNAGRFIKNYIDVDRVVVPKDEIMGYNLGEDSHNRYNHYLTVVSTGLINNNNLIDMFKGTPFPKELGDSVKRHGFRPLHTSVDTLIKNAEASDGKSNKSQLLEFNNIAEDYWKFAHLSESGELDIMGSNDIKIGKTLSFSPGTPYVDDKVFYIEGYSDNITVGPKGETLWVQTVQLTRGFREDELKTKNIQNISNDSFVQEGESTPSNSSRKK